MMDTLLLSYATDLNDAYPGHEFSLWSREQLLGYFNDALCVIASHRPDMFTEVKVVRVDPCHTYLNTCDCVKVISVIGQCDKHGRVLRPLQKRNPKSTVWRGIHKTRSFTTVLDSYELDADTNDVRVFPTNLHPTESIYVALRCSVGAPTYTLDDTPPPEDCAFISAARHWVLYNAKMQDGEFSQTMQRAATEHRDMFLGILKLVDSGDKRQSSK